MKWHQVILDLVEFPLKPMEVQRIEIREDE